jgi:endonuclease-3
MPAGRANVASRPSGAASTKARALFARLRALHPTARCELVHTGPFQLLVATVLSAQTTDVRVNQLAPALFARWPDAQALASASPAEVATFLATNGLGMHNQKAKNIVGLAAALVQHHRGEVPSSLEKLVALPGVGRKTANVVLGVAFGAPEGVVVDTHVQRLAQRLGWTKATEPAAIEQDLCRLFPRSDWDALAHVLIFHGRRVCGAVKPACAGCGINTECPSAFRAEKVGRKRLAKATAATEPKKRGRAKKAEKPTRVPKTNRTAAKVATPGKVRRREAERRP